MPAQHAQANRERMILTSMRSVECYISKNTAAWSFMKAFYSKKFASDRHRSGRHHGT
jgi:hypothetical protein